MIINGTLDEVSLIATAATIWTARRTAARIRDRDHHGAGSGDGRSGDRDGKLIRRRVVRGLCRAVPIHHRVSVKGAAIDRQGETLAACTRSVRHDLRDSGNDSGLRRVGLRGTVPARKAQHREQQHTYRLHVHLHAQIADGL